MNGAGLTPGSVAGSGAGGGGKIMGAEAVVHHKLVEVWGFVESDRESDPIPSDSISRLLVC